MLAITFLRQQNWSRTLRVVVAASFMSMFILHPVWADDTEIYFNSASSSTVKPNLLFILDASDSMAWFDCEDGSINKTIIPCSDSTENGNQSRLQRMVNAMKLVMGNLSDDLNVGLMRFGGFDGGRVIYPISDLAEPGVRQEIDDVIEDIELVLGTPTVGALEEAWRYYAGLEVKHGKTRTVTFQDRSKRSSRVSHPDSYTGGVVVGRGAACGDDLNSIECENERIEGNPIYTSPILSECQANYTVLLTDGEPWLGLMGVVPPAYEDTIASIVELNDDRECKDLGRNRLCGEEIARYMHTTDLIADMPEDQIVTTHTIGFNIQSSWIKDIATLDAGGGRYFEAESSADLVDAIDGIVSEVSESGTTIVAPSVTIDQFTRLSHREEIYLALFKPKLSANWVGNLKKYKFAGADASLKDKDGSDAVDTASGNFLATSTSYWSESPDGVDVLLGGAAGRLDPSTRSGPRRIVSNLDTTTEFLLAFDNPLVNTNEIHEDNALLTAAMMGVGESPSSALAGEVCFYDNTDWSYTGTVGNDFRQCHRVRNITPWRNVNSHNNAISAISVGSDVHAVIYDRWRGRGESMCIPSDTDINALRNLADRASSFEVRPGQCPGQDATTVVPDLDSIVAWLRGTDVKDENGDGSVSDARNHIGDPLHSTPTVVTYGVDPVVTGTGAAGADASNSLVFFGTNEGFLHAIDTESGDEEYAFMPRELLPSVGRLFADNDLRRTEVKPYGLDGDITIRTVDNNNNGLIESENSDIAQLYVGMRRGGRNYYSLDVSAKSQPKFKWSILGGTGDFAELGQTWSKPIPTQLKLGDDIKNVLVFGGGYDRSQDDATRRAPDTMGRAIYFVDADTGALIWSGGNPDSLPLSGDKHYGFAAMDYSIPANLSVVTDNKTGFMSQIYVGDMGGQLWRFDVNNGSDIDELVDGGVVAEFAEDGSRANARRFFGSPDLSLSKVDGKLTMNIAIGSGYRAHPLNRAVQDNFYILRYPYEGYTDTNDLRVYDSAIEGELYDATSNVIAEGTDTQISTAKAALADAKGWYISLTDSGEKVLDQSSTFQGVVRFVSYVPEISTDPCDPSLGRSYYYALNLLDGTPFEEINEGATHPNRKENRRREIATPGIAPPVSTIFVKNEGEGTITPTDVSGVNKIYEWGDVSMPRRWFWAEVPE